MKNVENVIYNLKLHLHDFNCFCSKFNLKKLVNYGYSQLVYLTRLHDSNCCLKKISSIYKACLFHDKLNFLPSFTRLDICFKNAVSQNSICSNYKLFSIIEI
ncbi:hypothetical protein BpHYR1_000984 [Brachionus plicatilis]|uniref:Uncharacterized protein n=1 Tax=Brachionus plicatilis TaxID=10195 RepID=A0A3M7T3E6_BRAPC|nr:hypothetical protein BpHYR1_000984 [Brachionus plicatilis]